jgi:hypothetical protein
MTISKLTQDILLRDLIEFIPEAEEVLSECGLAKFRELEIRDIVIQKLSVRGLFRLMEVSGEKQEEVWRRIQELYNKKLEEL